MKSTTAVVLILIATYLAIFIGTCMMHGCYNLEAVPVNVKANISCGFDGTHVCDAMIPHIIGTCIGQDGESLIDGQWTCWRDDLTCVVTTSSVSD